LHWGACRAGRMWTFRGGFARKQLLQQGPKRREDCAGEGTMAGGGRSGEVILKGEKGLRLIDSKKVPEGDPTIAREFKKSKTCC